MLAQVVVLQVLHHGVDVLKRRVHSGSELPPGGREQYTPVGAGEHRHTQPNFQLLDLPTHRPLRHIQAFAGLHEIFSPGRSRKHAQRIQRGKSFVHGGAVESQR